MYESLVVNRNIRKQILLTEKDANELKKVSEITGFSQNEIINRGLSAYLKRYKNKLSTPYGEMKNNK